MKQKCINLCYRLYDDAINLSRVGFFMDNKNRLKFVGIVLKDKEERAQHPLEILTSYFDSRSIDYFVIPSRDVEIRNNIKDKIKGSDLCVSLGGDGTFLFASRVFSRYNIPIIGINLGGLGFITEFNETEMLECIECFIRGNYFYEERMMIDVYVYRNGKTIKSTNGLNDLVISTGGISRLIELEVTSGKNYIGTYRADGIIVATPTGSTAYSLAAGGPILEPNMRVFVLSLICPHSLGARPLVIPSEEVIKIGILSEGMEITATIDGQVAFPLKHGDEVNVEKSKIVTKIVSLGKRSFYDIVREKLSWKG